jgi:hypothetical protein
MIGSKILALAYRLTNKSATTFMDGNTTTFYEDLNTLYGHRVLDILRMRFDKNANEQNATTDLVSTSGLVEGDNGYNGEYSFPSTLLKPTRIEVSYDGVTWKKCEIYDNAVNRGSEYNDTQLEQDFSQNCPRVDFFRNSFKIRPPKTSSGNITNGIYIEFEKRQSDFTSSTAPEDIESNLQDILAYDLAELETIMHAEKYTPQFMANFKAKKREVEDRFLEFYQNNLPTRKKVTIKYRNYA